MTSKSLIDQFDSFDDIKKFFNLDNQVELPLHPPSYQDSSGLPNYQDTFQVNMIETPCNIWWGLWPFQESRYNSRDPPSYNSLPSQMQPPRFDQNPVNQNNHPLMFTDTPASATQRRRRQRWQGSCWASPMPAASPSRSWPVWGWRRRRSGWRRRWTGPTSSAPSLRNRESSDFLTTFVHLLHHTQHSFDTLAIK